MKIITIFFFLAIPIVTFSQVDKPPKRASKIIVLISDTDNTLLNKVAKTLFEKGFTIDTKDESAKILSTKEYAPGHPSIFIKMRASINDTSIVFTGTYAWTLTSGLYPHAHEYTPIEYRGLKNSAAMQAWNSFDTIARMFGDKIVYSK
jgi:hypothetical protein